MPPRWCCAISSRSRTRTSCSCGPSPASTPSISGCSPAANGLVAQFEAADLFKPNLAPYGRFDKLLIDPPRQGAIEIVKSPLEARRIVYVSCDTATLARDAGVLVHTQGYRLVAAGVVNMFPHTAHVESTTLFEKGGSS